jgi:uncharacterized membrane protein
MSTVTGSVYVHCPIARVKQYLRQALEERKRVDVRAHISVGAIELSKSVTVHATICEDTPGRWDVMWEPEASGMYPSFEGQLTLRYHENDGKTILDLIGEYQPPLGKAGLVFDKVLGHQLASDTAQEFLMDLAGEVRARYAYDEALTAFGHPPDASPA